MEITFIGTFLLRELRRNWVHPRLRLNTLALTEMPRVWVAQTRAHCFELLASRLHHYTARCVVPRQSFSYKTTMTISTTTRQRTRPSPSPLTISCCNQQGPRSAFGIPNFCLIRTDLQDFQGRIVQTNPRIVRLASPRALAPCVMGAWQRCFFMT